MMTPRHPLHRCLAAALAAALIASAAPAYALRAGLEGHESQVGGALRATGMEEGWVVQVEKALAVYDSTASGTKAPALTKVRQALAQRDPAGVRQALEAIQGRLGEISLGFAKKQL